MKRFTQLFLELDESNRTQDKVDAMERYFRETPPEDASWGLFFLSGGKLKRLVSSTLLRDWIVEKSALPAWLVEESYETVGDLGETLALLHPADHRSGDLSLHQLVQERLQPLAKAEIEEKKRIVLATWEELLPSQRLLWNKMLLGNFRVGVSRTLVIRALAAVANVETGEMAHRLMGEWSPEDSGITRLLNAQEVSADSARPYPFYLAYPLEGLPNELGRIDEWQAEWKWDGIRSQLIRRGGRITLWSRGEDIVTERFPELATAASTYAPDGVVADGEILAWGPQGVRPFGDLQHRLGRRQVGAKLMADIPVALMFYDLLEWKGEDIRHYPLADRRALLEAWAATWPSGTPFRLSSTLKVKDWETLSQMQSSARSIGVEGLMLKRLSAPYGVGREKGAWWKWKIDPYHIDAVLIYAQRGHGRRASLYTDYTFGVWSNGALVPVAKAYSGLTDAEIRQVDNFIRRNTLESFGPVRVVKPELVFQIAFEGIGLSPRHKSGIAVRFPRMALWRKDKKPEEADTIETMKALITGPGKVL